MVDQREKAIQYAHENKTDFLDTYQEFLTIPSISTDKEHLPDINRAAEWLENQLHKPGDA